MTKARTSGQKLAERRRRALVECGLPGLAPSRKRKAQGWKRMQEIAAQSKEQDADVPVIAARCRQMGKAIDEAAIREARAEWRGCNAGIAMASVVEGEALRQELWTAIQHMRMVQAAYDRAIGAPNRHAKSLRILMPIEPMEADASSPSIDLRTDEERVRQAVVSWGQVQGWLDHAGKRAADLCRRVVLDDERCSDPKAMVAALRCVAYGLAGRWIVYKGA